MEVKHSIYTAEDMDRETNKKIKLLEERLIDVKVNIATLDCCIDILERICYEK